MAGRAKPDPKTADLERQHQSRIAQDPHTGAVHRDPFVHLVARDPHTGAVVAEMWRPDDGRSTVNPEFVTFLQRVWAQGYRRLRAPEDGRPLPRDGDLDDQIRSLKATLERRKSDERAA